MIWTSDTHLALLAINAISHGHMRLRPHFQTSSRLDADGKLDLLLQTGSKSRLYRFGHFCNGSVFLKADDAAGRTSDSLYSVR